MTNNQTKRGIIYKKITMRESDGERIINYEWPYGKLRFTKIISLFMCTKCRLKNFSKLLQRKKNDMNKTPLSQILQKVTLVPITAE